mmetsp:Transcript_1759/g.5924  ORF Transcript_1759/g.5924 Transcript_1759/m.5924 type:complete len:377 (+) Transcript_1759:38-1168(+)
MRDDVESSGAPPRFETSLGDALWRQHLSIVTYVVGLFVCYVVHDALQERAFRQPGFRFGYAMSCVEIFAFFLCASLKKGGQRPMGKTMPWFSRDLVALAAVIAVSQGAGSAALAYVDYPLKVAAKSSKLVPTLLCSTCLTGARYGVSDYAAAVLLCVGLAALGLAAKDYERADTRTFGFFLLAVAVFSDAVIPNLQDKLLRQLAIPSTTMVLLSNLGSFVLVLVFILCTGELAAFVAYVRLRPDTATWLAAQALSAYVGLRCYLGVIKELGGVAGVLATSARKVITLILSFLLFRKPFTTNHAIAFLLLAAGVALNLAAKVMRNNNTQKTRHDDLLNSSNNNKNRGPHLYLQSVGGKTDPAASSQRTNCTTAGPVR